MKELNAEIDPSALSEEGDIPYSADSLRVISDNLSGTDLSDEDDFFFQKILWLLNNDDLETGIEKARSELKKLKFELPEGQNLFSVKRKFRSKVRALLELRK